MELRFEGGLPFVFDVPLEGEYFADQSFFFCARHEFKDHFFGLADHDVSVLPPDAVVGLGLKDGAFGDVLPAVLHLGGQFDQPLLQFRSPQVFPNARIDDVAVALSDLQFAFDYQLLGDECPPFDSEVLAEYDEHEGLSGGPSA